MSKKFKFSEEAIKAALAIPKGNFQIKSEGSPYRDITGLSEAPSQKVPLNPILEAKDKFYDPLANPGSLAMDKAYEDQNAFDVVGNALGGLAKQAVAGALLGFAGNDAISTTQMLAGTKDVDFANPVHKLGMDILKSAQTKNAIFQNSKANSRFLTGEYWAQQTQSLGLTLGIMLEAFGEQALLSLATGGLGMATAPLKTASTVKKLATLKNLAFGGYQGIKEANMNALFTADEVRENYRQMGGYTEEEIEKLANETATKAFRTELAPMILMNAVQFGGIGHSNIWAKESKGWLGASGAVEEMGTKLMRSAGLGTKAAKVASTGLQMGSEAFEESYQNAISKYSQYQTDVKEGTTGGKTLSDYLWTESMADEGIAGALGGFFFSKIGGMMGRRGAKNAEKRFNEQYDLVLKAYANSTEDTFSDLKNGMELGSEGATSLARKKLVRDGAVTALRWDMMKGSENTEMFNAHLRQLNDVLKAVETNDTATLDRLGINNDEDKDFIQKNYPDYIQESLDIKEDLEKNTAKSLDYDSGEKLTQLTYMRRGNTSELARTKTRLTELTQSPDFQALPVELQNYVHLQAEFDALDNNLHNTPEQKARKEIIKSELSALKSDTFNPKKLTQSQKDMLAATSEVASINDVYNFKTTLELEVEKNTKEVAKLSTLEGQFEHKKERFLEMLPKISKIKNEATLNKIAEEATKLGVYDEALKNSVEGRKQEIKATQKASKGVKVKTKEEKRAKAKPEVVEESPVTSKQSKAEAVESLKRKAEAIAARRLEQEQVAKEKAQQALEASSKQEFYEVPNPEADVAAMRGVEMINEDDLDKHAVVTEEDLFGPGVTYGKPVFATNDALKKTFKDRVKEVIDYYADKDLNLDFETLLSYYISLNPVGAEKSFYYLANAWKENGKPEVENLDKIYDKYFFSQKQSDLMKMMAEMQEEDGIEKIGIEAQKVAVTETQAEESAAIVDRAMAEADEALADEEVKTSNEVSNDQIAEGTPKIPFLGLKYTIEYNALTGTYEYVTESLELNRDGSRTDLDTILDFRNFKKGTTFTVEVRRGWLNALVQDWTIEEKGNLVAEAVTMSKWLSEYTNEKGEKIFTEEDILTFGNQTLPEWRTEEQRQAWLSKVPMDMISEDGRNLGPGVHDIDWWNERNVASFNRKFPNNPLRAQEEQQKVIKSGIENAMKIRENVYKGNNKMVVTNRRSGHTARLRKPKPGELSNLRTISQANPTCGMAFVNVNKKTATIKNPTAKGSLAVTSDKILNWDSIFSGKEKMPDGMAFMLTESSLDSEGNVLYVLNQVVTDNEIFQDSFDRLQTSLKIIKEYVDVLRDQQNGVKVNPDKLKEARELKEKIQKQTGINIADFSKPNFSGYVQLAGLYPTTGRVAEKGTVVEDEKGKTSKSYKIYTRENGKPHYAIKIQEYGYKMNYMPIFSRDVNGKVQMDNYTSKYTSDAGYEAFIKDYTTTQMVFFPIQVSDNQGGKKTIYTPYAQPIIQYDLLEEDARTEEEKEVTPIKAEPKKVESKEETKEETPTLGDVPKVVKTPIEKLTFGQRQRVLGYIINNIQARLGAKEISKSDVVSELKNTYTKMLEKLAESGDFEEEVAFLSQEDIKNEILGIGKFAKTPNSIREQIEILNGIKIREVDLLDDSEQEDDYIDPVTGIVKGLDAAAYEYNVKNSISARLKRLLSGIPKEKVTTQNVEFGGLEEYYSADDVFDTIQRLLADVPNSFEDFEKRLRAKLTHNPDTFEFLTTVLDRFTNLETMDEQLRHEFLFKLNQTKNDMFLIQVKEKGDDVTLQVLNANSKEPILRIQQDFNNSFKSSKIITRVEDGYKVDKEAAKEVLNKFELIVRENVKTNFNKVSAEEMKDWLLNFGIVVSDRTIQNLKDVQPGADANGGKTWETNFNKGGLFFNLVVNLRASMGKEKLDFIKESIITKNNKGHIKSLAILEANNRIVSGTAMRVAGKTIMPLSQPSFASEQTRKLKDKNSALIQNLKMASFSKHSMLLSVLSQDSEEGRKTRNLLNLSYVSLQAIKKKKNKDRMGITEISSTDYDVVSNGFFQFEGNPIAETSNGIKLYNTKMQFPPLSDSAQEFLLDTLKMHLTMGDFFFNEDGSVEIGDNVLELLFSQLVLPDLQRITDYLANKEGNEEIEGHELGSQIFMILPALNTLQVEGVDLITYIHKTAGEFKKTVPENLEFTEDTVISDTTKEDIKKFIQDMVMENVNSKVAVNEGVVSGTWLSEGILVPDEKKGFTTILDAKYIKATGGKDIITSARIAALDFVINNYVHQAQLQMLYSGDMANYADNPKKVLDFKGVAGATNTEKFWNKMQTLSLEERTNAYNDYIKLTSINFFKRMKEQLSPGNRLAESKGKTYVQVVVNDREDSSNTLAQLVKLWYPDTYKEHEKDIERLKVLEGIIADAKETPDSDTKFATIAEAESEMKTIKGVLSKAYPSILGGKNNYMEINYTDGQEFTTWKEHLDVLYYEGKISKKLFDKVTEKLTSQSTDGVNKENLLSKSERKAIFQPIKPLHSGMYFTQQGDFLAQRFVYVKTSSFPLVPEMTKGLKVDDTRKNIEKYEQQTGRNVRVTYKSGIKVGAPVSSIDVEELYNTDYEQIKDKLEVSSIVLDRENFSIQQDKPFKTDKHIEEGVEDSINRGTQIDKILLGNGINKITAKIFPNMFDKELLEEVGIENTEMLSGVDLYAVYNHIAIKEQQNFRRELFEELGIKDNTDWYNTPETLEKIKNLLSERLNNYQDAQVIQLKFRAVSAEGHILYLTKEELQQSGLTASGAEFNIPIWISPNSQKFESVLNSVVNNRTIKLTLPGGSSPVASSEGFIEKRDEAGLTEDERGGIIYTSSYNPEVGLTATHYEDGKIKSAQVFLPSKLRVKTKDSKGRVRNELLDFSDEAVLNKYTQLVDGRRVVKSEMIDSEILTMFSFRIPTSSHQSGTLIEVAGFLPHAMGDVMIVPKDHVTQIGEDFDIDVRYYYKQHTITDKDGKIRRLRPSDFPQEASGDITTRQSREAIYDAYQKARQEVKTYLKDKVWSAWSKNDEVFQELYFTQLAYDALRGERMSFQEGIEEELGELEEKIETLRNMLMPKGTVKEAKSRFMEELKTALDGLKDKRDSDLALVGEYVSAKAVAKNKAKILENNIVAIYKSIYSSPNADVQKKIGAVLSTEFAASTTKIIQDKMATSKKSSFYSIYDDRVQKEALKLGASGKLGIGVHSNWVVFNSLIEQQKEPLRLISFIDEDGNAEYFNLSLGGLVSNGYLGGSENEDGDFINGRTLDGERTISVSNMENQNCSTDNQKIQIMGKRNENKYTINEYALMCNLGFDVGVLDNGTKVHIPSLFLSQPILRRYAELKEEYDSLFASFSKDVEQEITERLKAEFGAGIEFVATEAGQTNFMNPDAYTEASAALTAQGLVDNLSTPQNAQQWAVFQKFIQLKSSVKSTNKVMQLLNIEKDGLGISFFNTIGKKDALMKAMTSEGLKIEGVEALFGEALTLSVNNTEAIEAAAEEGFIYVYSDGQFNYYRKPTTSQNAKVINSLSIGYNLWKEVFPFENEFIQQQLDTILDSSDVTRDSNKELEMKYEILSSLKDFMYTHVNAKLYQEDIIEERKRLTIDTPTNISLAKRLNDLKNKGHVLFEQPFFRDLELDIFTDGRQPSIIKYSVSSASAIDKNSAYIILESLVDNDNIIDPSLGDYTYSDLVRDLTKYALMSDQANGAIGFRNYIPMAALEKYGVNSVLKSIASAQTEQNYFNHTLNGDFRFLLNLTNSRYDETEGLIEDRNTTRTSKQDSLLQGIITRINSTYGDNTIVWDKEARTFMVNNLDRSAFNSLFVEQFFQHSPENAVKLDWKNRKDFVSEYNSTKLEELNSLVLKPEVAWPDFMSIKKPKSSDYILLKHIGEGRYKRINTLGGLGMNEYSTRSRVTVSLYKDNNNVGVASKKAIHVEEGTSNTISSRSLTEADTVSSVLAEIIAKNTNSKYTQILKSFQEFAKPTKFKVTALDGFDGIYQNGVIYIDPRFAGDIHSEAFQKLLVEEYLHSITADEIENWVEESGISLVDGKLVVDVKVKAGVQPYAITKLIDLYKQGLQAVFNKRIKEGMTPEGVLQHFTTLHDSFKISLEDKQGDTNRKTFSAKDQEEAYRTLSIQEFVAGVFVSPEFREILDKTPYKSSSNSILKEFMNTVKKLVTLLTQGKAVANSITEHTIDSIFALLNEQKGTPVVATVVEDVNLFEEEATNDDALRQLAKSLEVGPIAEEYSTVTPLKSKENILISSSTTSYSRKLAENNPRTLYVFTDNTDRTSGTTPNVTGWYAEKYGKGLSFGTENNPTTAVLRGMKNAYPISTMKWFYKNHGVTVNNARWTDSDFEDFKKVIDDEINQIKEAWNSGKYDNIVIPSGDGFFNSKIANISKERTPKLYKYLQQSWSSFEKEVNQSETHSLNQEEVEVKIVANIPQNLVSGIESFGTKQEANNEAKKLLGESPHSIDMIEAGIRTRTTRSVGEMQKYNIKVGDIVVQFGKSSDGTTKRILTRVTAIHPKGTPEFLNTWNKEGWTQDGIKAIERYKDGAAAIEFEKIEKVNEAKDSLSNEKGIEISSNSKGLGGALTNPTELAKKKGNIKSSYPIRFGNRIYKDVEEGYQDLKSHFTKDDGPASTYTLMVGLLKAKLEQHPKLREEIKKLGGSEWILASTHQPTSQNSVWETGGKNWFIKALNEAYLGTEKVEKPTEVVKKQPEVSTTTTEEYSDTYGTSYKFVFSPSKEILEAYYKQGNGEYQPMNKKKWKSKYDEILLSKFTKEDTEPYNQGVVKENEFIFADGTKVKTGFTLNSQQAEALQDMADFFNDKSKNSFTLQGYAGTGKTTIVKFLVEYIEKNNPFTNIVFSTPTNRANAVLKNSLGRNSRVLTLHKAFGLSPLMDLEEFNANKIEFDRQNEEKLKAGDFLIIDESSMINDDLYDFIMKTSKELKVRVIFMGDPAQLRPVGKDSLSKVFTNIEETYELTKVERTGNNPLLAEVTHIRDTQDEEPLSYVSKSNEAGEGVTYIQFAENLLDKVVEYFSSDEFKKNPLLIRLLASTNAKVVEFNKLIRRGIFGKKAAEENEYIEGDILMGYSNFDVDYRTGEAKITNSGDYIVKKVYSNVTKNISGIAVLGYTITVQSLLEDIQPKTFFILSKENPQEVFEALGAKFEELRNNARTGVAGGMRKGEAWRPFFEFQNAFATPVNISYKGDVKIKKTLDYGYSHTIHKSQGGTYKYIAVDSTNINSVFPDKQIQKQLKYVALSRATTHAYVLANQEIAPAIIETAPIDSFTEDQAPDLKEIMGDTLPEVGFFGKATFGVKPELERLFSEGRILVQGFYLTLEDFNSMTTEEQDNFKKCL